MHTKQFRYNNVFRETQIPPPPPPYSMNDQIDPDKEIL